MQNTIKKKNTGYGEKQENLIHSQEKNLNRNRLHEGSNVGFRKDVKAYIINTKYLLGKYDRSHFQNLSSVRWHPQLCSSSVVPVAALSADIAV